MTTNKRTAFDDDRVTAIVTHDYRLTETDRKQQQQQHTRRLGLIFVAFDEYQTMAVWRKALPKQFPRGKWKILRGDQVMILAGKDRGVRIYHVDNLHRRPPSTSLTARSLRLRNATQETGTVTKVIRDETFPRVIVENLNLNKRPVKKTQENPGGMVSVESPIAYSNVSLIDPVTKHPVKAAWRYLEDGTKVRVTRGGLASGAIVPRPEVLVRRRKPKPVSLGGADTAEEVAEAQTYIAGSRDLPAALKAFMQEMRGGGEAGEGGSVRFKKLRRAVIAKAEKQ